MTQRLLSCLLGVVLIGFGFSIQLCYSGISTFKPNKFKLSHRSVLPSSFEFREKMRTVLNTDEKKLYNQIRAISKDTQKPTKERIEELIKLSESKEFSQEKKNLILSNAVLLAHTELEGDERGEVLEELKDKTPQAKWLLRKSPNVNLLKVSKLQYDVLTSDEDL